jgi:hypothetical protein
MKRTIIFLAIAALVLSVFFFSMAFIKAADENEGAVENPFDATTAEDVNDFNGSAGTAVQKETILDFEEVSLYGDLQKPHGTFIPGDRDLKFESLIAMRNDFEPEMKKSADKLK